MELAIPLESISIRSLTKKDFEVLFDESGRHFATTWLERQMRGEVYLATIEVDHQAVGRAGLDFTHQPDYAWLWAAYIRPMWRSKGIGSYLLAHIEEITRIAGYDQLHLGVAKDNARAQELYKRLGWSTYAGGVSRWSYPENGKIVRESEEIWLMIKDLEQENGKRPEDEPSR
jgi:ribosomal protein S18 acetylase RimI-like enzyme